MRPRPWLGVCLVLMCAASPCALAQDRTEQDLLDAILRDSAQAAAIRAPVDVVRREQATRTLLPNPNVTYLREGAGFTEFLQGEQQLPVFGVRSVLARAGGAAVEAAEAERDARLWLLRADARQAIARLAAGHERLADAEATVAAIARLVQMLRVREQEGEGSRFDRVRAEQELTDARQVVMSAAIGVATARGELSALVPAGAAIGRVSTTASSESLPAVEGLLQRARSARAELRALERTALRFSHESDAARRGQRPTPTVMGGFKRADDGGGARESGGVFGLTINVPLFNTGAREAARWDAERQRVERERLAVDAAIRGEVMRADEIANIHRRALDEVSVSRTGGDELVQIADTAYREGDVGILELLDAYRTAARARIRALEVGLNARLAEIALERAVGETLWP